MNDQTCCDNRLMVWWEMRGGMDVWRCANCGREIEQPNDCTGGR